MSKLHLSNFIFAVDNFIYLINYTLQILPIQLVYNGIADIVNDAKIFQARHAL